MDAGSVAIALLSDGPEKRKREQDDEDSRTLKEKHRRTLQSFCRDIASDNWLTKHDALRKLVMFLRDLPSPSSEMKSLLVQEGVFDLLWSILNKEATSSQEAVGRACGGLSVILSRADYRDTAEVPHLYGGRLATISRISTRHVWWCMQSVQDSIRTWIHHLLAHERHLLPEALAMLVREFLYPGSDIDYQQAWLLIVHALGSSHDSFRYPSGFDPELAEFVAPYISQLLFCPIPNVRASAGSGIIRIAYSGPHLAALLASQGVWGQLPFVLGSGCQLSKYFRPFMSLATSSCPYEDVFTKVMPELVAYMEADQHFHDSILEFMAVAFREERGHTLLAQEQELGHRIIRSLARAYQTVEKLKVLCLSAIVTRGTDAHIREFLKQGCLDDFLNSAKRHMAVEHMGLLVAILDGLEAMLSFGNRNPSKATTQNPVLKRLSGKKHAVLIRDIRQLAAVSHEIHYPLIASMFPRP